MEKMLKNDDLTSNERAELYFLLSAQYLRNDNKKSLEFGKRYLDTLSELKAPTDKIKLAERIIIEAKTDKNSQALVQLNFEIGNLYRRNELATALHFYEKGLSISTGLKSSKLIAESYSNIAYVHNKRGDYKISMPILEKAIKLAGEVNDAKVISKCYSQIGEIYYYQGAFDKTLIYYLKALVLDEKSGDLQEISKSLNNIGTIYYRIGDLAKADEYFVKALEIKLTLPNEAGIAYSYNNLGAVNYALQKYDEALQYYQNSLKIREKLNDTRGSISNCSNIGAVYFDLKQSKEALAWFNRAYDLSLKLNDKHNAALVAGNISSVSIEFGEYDKAVESAKIELDLALELDELPLQNSAYNVLAKAYEGLGNCQLALKYEREFKRTSDEIYHNDSEKNIFELKAKFDLEKKKIEAEIFKLKNVELANANEVIQKKNKELEGYKDDLLLINKILRHDIANNLAVMRSAVRLYRKNSEESMLIEVENRVNKCINTIRNQRNLEEKLVNTTNFKRYTLDEIGNSLTQSHADIKINVIGKGEFYVDEAITSVFDNLLNNSILHGKASSIDISIKSNEDHYEIRFADNGIGIPDKIKDRIFEEGFIYGETGHTGIGLHIVKNTIERYGGQVFVENNKLQGTTFVICLKKVLK